MSKAQLLELGEKLQVAEKSYQEAYSAVTNATGDVSLDLITKAETAQTELKGIKEQINRLKGLLPPETGNPNQKHNVGTSRMTMTGGDSDPDTVTIDLGKGDVRDVRASNLYGNSVDLANAVTSKNYHKAMGEYFRHKGNYSDMQDGDADLLRKTKALVMGSDVSAGVLATPMFMQELLRREAVPVSVADLVRNIPITGPSVAWAKMNYTGATDDPLAKAYTSPIRMSWTGETQRPSQAADAQLGSITLTAHECKIEAWVSRTLLEDGFTDPVALISEFMREAYRTGLEYAILREDGVMKPQGIVPKTTNAYTTTPSTDLYNYVPLGTSYTVASLIDFYYKALPSVIRAQQGVTLLLPDSAVFADWLKLEDTEGRLVFGTKSIDGSSLSNERVETFFGKPIMYSPFLGEGANDIVALLGLFKSAYATVTRVGGTIALEDLASNDYVKVIFRGRIGGGITNTQALVGGKKSAS